ncbi:hypothetical protein GOP47_0022167, partial [Adiantum capillus-veneris]
SFAYNDKKEWEMVEMVGLGSSTKALSTAHLLPLFLSILHSRITFPSSGIRAQGAPRHPRPPRACSSSCQDLGIQRAWQLSRESDRGLECLGICRQSDSRAGLNQEQAGRDLQVELGKPWRFGAILL